MSKSSLYLRPLNGLCNRMRAIASAHALAARVQSRLVVFWDINADVGTRYEEIFRPDDRFKIVNVSPRDSLRDALLFLLYGELESVSGLPTRWITRWFFRNHIFGQVRPRDFSDCRLEQIVRGAKRTLITSWWSFYGEAKLDFSIFSLHQPQQQEVDDISRSFTESIVGVHIRRADNANAIRYSPTHAFIAAMKDCVVADPDARFFLTTDCTDTEWQIKSIFRDRIITRRRKISRSSADGMRDAVVDLFLLSRTSRILGSYYSTFSETAASIGGIQWVTVTDDASLVGRINSKVLVAQS
jgi:hypothetical protein